jgi:DNA-binding transcriptional ArsR family regulator
VNEVFKALADPTRRSLLDALYEKNGQTLGELCTGMQMTRQAVTQHLAVLETANLVITVRHGREKIHYLNPAPLYEISERWLGKYDPRRLEALGDLNRALENKPDRERWYG